MALQVTAFGEFTIESGNRQRYAVSGVRQRALLAYLALSSRNEFSRGHLAGLLWPEVSEDEARHSLRQCLSTIRRALGVDADALTLEGDRVGLDRAQFETDVDRLRQLGSSTNPLDWQGAGELCRGELLAGLDLGGTPFDEWLVHQRRVSSDETIAVLLKVADAQAEAGDAVSAIATLRRTFLLDPFDETGRRRLMRLLLRDGRSAAAIREYRDFSALLREQLDVTPSVETEQIYREALESHGNASEDESELLKSYAGALEQFPDCVIVTDLATRIVGFSPVAEHSFGMRKEEVVGKTPAILHAADHETAVPLQLTHLALTHGRWTETVELTTHDGGIRSMRRSVVTLRDPSGRPIGAFGVSSGSPL
jgi:PAS domain S-box-containing protein